MIHRTTPCDQCPFRRNSAPGWLGPWDANILLQAIIPYQQFPCHKTIHREDDVTDPRLRTCAGAGIFLNNHLRVSQNRDMATAQMALKACTEELKASVFNSPSEFLDHHTSHPGARKMPVEGTDDGDTAAELALRR